MVGADEGYLLANEQSQAGSRFDALATLFDPSMFRHLLDLGVGAGLRCWEVGAFPITSAACAALERATVEQIRERLIDAGIATAAEIDEHIANIDTGRVPDLATSPMISAWGRRPDVSL